MQVKNCEGSYMALKVGSAAAWSIPTDGATTALSGSLFHTGIVLMKNEYLYASMKENITCFLYVLLFRVDFRGAWITSGGNGILTMPCWIL